ncbi:MAG: type II toxin-antitoxin system RelE/ParE family toxin [Verrucomicrobiota bacterium]
MLNSVSVSKPAAKFLRHIRDKKLYERLCLAINGLKENPYPPESVKLAGTENQYRIRVGNYRILYEVIGTVLMIHAIGHRREIYR